MLSQLVASIVYSENPEKAQFLIVTGLVGLPPPK